VTSNDVILLINSTKV